MWTVVELFTGEAVQGEAGPVLFDSEAEAQAFCLARGLSGREYQPTPVDGIA
jgi:hypothetical protein